MVDVIVEGIIPQVRRILEPTGSVVFVDRTATNRDGIMTSKLERFYREHYPGITYTPVNASTPTALITALKALDGGGNGGNGDEPPPPEPRQTRGHIGLHLQNNASGVTEFVRDVQPSVMKVVMGFERALPILADSPHTTMVCRHYSGNDYGGILDADDPHVGAKRWLAQFEDSAIALSLRTDKIIYWESINEVMPSLNADAVERAVRLDMAFIDVVMDLGIDNIRPAVFCVAVGNPHESEYPLLVPLARKCEAAGGRMGLHDYWLSNPDYGGPDHLWPYLAGRWTEMDKVFVENGVHVRWYGGESGPVGGRSSAGEAGKHSAYWGRMCMREVIERGMGVGRAQFRTDDDWPYGIVIGDTSPRALERGDWVALYPHDGWKSPECLNGDQDRLQCEIARKDELTAEWNAAHDDRVDGSVPFTTSGPGWDSFDIGTREIAGIGAMLRERYP